jgi:hypothetical protein
MQKLANSEYSFIGDMSGVGNPWAPDDIDKMESPTTDEYPKIVKECRFFYRKDSIASTVINKMVELGVTDIVIPKGKLSSNEYKIFQGIKEELQEFIEDCALEYLVTGLVIPEVKYAPVSSDKIREFGIKKYSSLTLPVEMWVRDPAMVKINTSFVFNKPSYFLKVPPKLVFFIQNKGQYPDGTKDVQLYQLLMAYYPAFCSQVLAGQTDIPIENDYVIRRKVLSDSPYPTPFLLSAIEPLRHKRNLRRLDYSIASRAIGAIQQFKVGNDEFPVTIEDQSVFENLKNQMAYRNSNKRDVEKIFQLFTNHTVEIDWVYPPLDALLNETKYVEVNEDIFFSLGFPRILTTGEAQRTGSSDPEYASISPVKSMNNMQRKLLIILRGIIKNIVEENKLSDTPVVSFKPISIISFKAFIEGLRNLYDTGNLSRATYAGSLGYNLDEELRLRAEEKDKIKELGIEDFAIRPFTNQPGQPGVTNNQKAMDSKSNPPDKTKVDNSGGSND